MNQLLPKAAQREVIKAAGHQINGEHDEAAAAMQRAERITAESEQPRAQHTPGPWTIIPASREGHTHRLQEPGGHVFAVIGARGVSREQDANANLIAAAPDLLAALKTMLFNQIHGDGLEAHCKAEEAARAAIAKATGTE